MSSESSYAVEDIPEAVVSNQPDVDVSVIVPISSEKDEYESIYREYSAELERLGKRYEFLFILDGLDREASDEIAKLRERGGPIRIISLSRPFGEGVALSAGFQRARGEVLLTLPPYLQTDSRDVEKMLREVENGCDIVAARRYPRVDPKVGVLQSTIFNWVTRKLTSAPLHDLNCGLRALRRRVCENIPIYGDFHRFLPILAMVQGYRVTEVKVRHLKEKGRAGFYGVGMYWRRFLDILTLFFLTRFSKKPLRFFGPLGAGMLGTGFIVTLYLGIYRLMGAGSIRERPLLLLGVLLLVLGIQTFSLGLIGEIIIFVHARDQREYHIEEILE